MMNWTDNKEGEVNDSKIYCVEFFNQYLKEHIGDLFKKSKFLNKELKELRKDYSFFQDKMYLFHAISPDFNSDNREKMLNLIFYYISSWMKHSLTPCQLLQ